MNFVFYLSACKEFIMWITKAVYVYMHKRIMYFS